jgi:hypothetical protein
MSDDLKLAVGSASASVARKSNPHAGATQQDIQAATVAIVAIQQAIDADPLGPTKVLADGKRNWINSFLREMREFRLVDRNNAEILWVYFNAEHGRRFPGETPSQVLDAHSEVSPLTAQEIRDSIKIETASAPEMRRQVYGPDDYDFDNHARKLVDDIPDEALLSRARQDGAGNES